MASDHLSDPPMIVTDIPTNEQYKKPYSYTGYAGYSGYATYEGDSTSKYSFGLDYQYTSLLDIGLIPNSVQDQSYKHGLVAIVQTWTQGTAFGGLLNAKVMIHKPGGNLGAYTHDWVEVPGTTIGIGTGNFGFNTVEGRVFSQRQGEYTYALMKANADYGSGTVGFKFNRGEFNQVWHSESFYLSDFSPLFDMSGDFFVSDDANPFIWHGSGSFRSLSNGDDAQQGTFNFGVIEDGSPTGSYRFIDDNTGGDPYSNSYGLYIGPGSGYHFTGKAASFRQKYSIPRGQWGHGPYLVDPWRSGSYNPPEQWFYIQEYDHRGLVTGRYNIYRSQWKKGQYKRYDNPRPDQPLRYWTVIFGTSGISPYGQPVDPVNGGPMLVPNPETFNFHPDRARSFEELPVTIDDDPKYNLGPHVQGGTRYPRLNPDGYAFEHDWFNKAHFVGTVGPFSNFYMRNPKNTPQANAQNFGYGVHQGVYGNDSNATDIRDIKVIRDRKRRGVLHMIATDGVSVWFSDSHDDGRTWTRGVQAQGPHGFARVHGEVNNGYGAAAGVGFQFPRISAERLFEDATVMGCSYNVDGIPQDKLVRNRLSLDRYGPGARMALFVVDYTGTGVGNAKETGVIFKRGELNRHSWL